MHTFVQTSDAKKLRPKQIYININIQTSFQLSYWRPVCNNLPNLFVPLPVDRPVPLEQPILHPRVVKDWYAQSPTLLAIGQTSCGLNESWSSHHVGSNMVKHSKQPGHQRDPNSSRLVFLKRALPGLWFFVFRDFLGELFGEFVSWLSRSCWCSIVTNESTNGMDLWCWKIGSQDLSAYTLPQEMALMPDAIQVLANFLQLRPVYIQKERRKKRMRERDMENIHAHHPSNNQ